MHGIFVIFRNNLNEIWDFCHGTVSHERVWDRNYVILLHSYGDLCYRLHIYFLTPLCLYIQPYHSPTHNQHQHICLCVGDEPQHFSTKNFTLSHSKQSKPKAFPKTFIPHLVFQTHHYLQRKEVSLKVTKHLFKY
jgi:hypothetical protein